MRKKIQVDQLKVGMYLEGLVGSWMSHPFWRSKFVIRDHEDIRAIADSGISEVWVDVSKGDDIAAAPAPPIPAQAIALEPTRSPAVVEAATKIPMSEEIVRARRICAAASSSVVSMFQEARMGQAISTESASELVEEISSSVLRNPGALVSLARLKTADDYTYMHSVAVCALMISLARTLDLDEEQTRDAGMAGLMHDLGKALVPMAVLNKPGKLTDEEFAIVKRHPELGHRLLVDGGAARNVVLDTCLHHHERTDGSGYPHRLAAGEISLHARMGAVCDIYDAITSNRPYKAGWDPGESIKKMAAWCNGHLDEFVFRAFVRSIGIYPIGSLLRLGSGRLAVVIEHSPDSLLKPRVMAFFSIKSQLYVTPEVVDLARVSSRDGIVSAEDPNKWGIVNLERFWAGTGA